MAFSLKTVKSRFQMSQMPRVPDLHNMEIVKYHEKKGLGRIGTVLILLALLCLSAQVLNGFVDRYNQVQDTTKLNNIRAVIEALALFYKDSSMFPEQRAYPLSRCSSELNSFDYEYTLRTVLTGQQFQRATHPYINPNDFPEDHQGTYRDTFSHTFECKNALPTTQQNSDRYFDNARTCVFDAGRHKNCFLYTSTLSGDGYRLAYWSPFYNRFVVFDKKRLEPIVTRLV